MSTAPAVINCPACPACPSCNCPKCEPIVTAATAAPKKEDGGMFSWLPISPFWISIILLAIGGWWFMNNREGGSDALPNYSA